MMIVLNSGALGEKVRYLRKKLKYSRKCLARAAGISDRTLSGVENGLLRDIDSGLLRRLCVLLHTTVQDLIN